MYADIIDIQSISTMAWNKMVSVCGYISNNITNKHYWPKTGRSSQNWNMCQKVILKTKLIQKKLQNFLPKDINKSSWTDNVHPNIKLNINTNWEELPSETT